ncbi:MAG: hypothetical protein KC464_34225, partial [Myxococcales bacterium]|nr:hypothetical protein [Myxococcales bacterium]
MKYPALALAVALGGCFFDSSGVGLQAGDGGPIPDAATDVDAVAGDGGVDAAPIDAAPIDAAPIDAAPIDAAPIDATPIDAMPIDAMPIDGTPPITDNVAHVPAAEEYGGTADLALGDGTLIDTTTLSVGMALPTGVTFTTSAQEGATGPELAILHVDHLTISGTVTVRGSRALVVIATSSIDVTAGATLDAGGKRQVPGASG